jgi:dihydrofolate synthase/folylpolyglutamate synthase
VKHEPGELIAQLLALRAQSVELGLAPITRLLDRLDHPERDIPAVHVGGTNGKGSTSAMIAAQLEAAGLRTGLLTSPHLVDFTERIRVDGVPIARDEATPILAALRTNDTYDGSFFEVATALAFEHFRRRGVDIAVLEVGLGGRLDATNVCHPLVTAITSIDFDHTESLGNDLVSIATEKAGIVKPGVPLVLGPIADEPRDAIDAIAARRDAEVLVAADLVHLRLVDSSWDGLEVAVRLPHHLPSVARVPLPGRHQLANLAVAIAAARLVDGESDSWEPMLAGLARTLWAGRLQRVAGNPVRVYDVAHNAGGARALAATLQELGIPRGSVLVFGVLSDKDVGAMAASLAPHFERAVTVTPPHPMRARPAAQSAAALARNGVEAVAHESVADALRHARMLLGPEGWLVVTGSLFTVGAAMEQLGDAESALHPARTR